MTTPTLTLIGLCGAAHSGKDAAADHLVREYGFVRAAFADALKDMLEQHLTWRGIDYAWLHEPDRKNLPIPELGVSARELLQRLGDALRDVHPDWWVNALASHIGLPGTPGAPQAPAAGPVHDRIIITDVRYPNEAAWLRQHGGLLLGIRRAQATPVRAHSSEQHIAALQAQADTLIVNDGHRLASLHTLLDGLLASLHLGPRDELALHHA